MRNKDITWDDPSVVGPVLLGNTVNNRKDDMLHKLQTAATMGILFFFSECLLF